MILADWAFTTTYTGERSRPRPNRARVHPDQGHKRDILGCIMWSHTPPCFTRIITFLRFKIFRLVSEIFFCKNIFKKSVNINSSTNFKIKYFDFGKLEVFLSSLKRVILPSSSCEAISFLNALEHFRAFLLSRGKAIKKITYTLLKKSRKKKKNLLKNSRGKVLEKKAYEIFLIFFNKVYVIFFSALPLEKIKKNQKISYAFYSSALPLAIVCFWEQCDNVYFFTTFGSPSRLIRKGKTILCIFLRFMLFIIYIIYFKHLYFTTLNKKRLQPYNLSSYKILFYFFQVWSFVLIRQSSTTFFISSKQFLQN